MKKVFTIAFFLLISVIMFAQDKGENELKNFRFGLKGGSSLNWYKPDSKKISMGKTKVGWDWGFQLEFRLAKVASIMTGLEIAYDKGTLSFPDTAKYFYDAKEEVLLEKGDTTGKQYVSYKLNDRFYRCNYIVLPLYLKMKTPEVGYMTWFGEFGANAGFKIKAKVNDNVTQYAASNPSSSLTDLENKDDMNFFKFQGHVAAGMEYNLAGSTSAFISIAYNIGISNVLKKESRYLLKNDFTPLAQKASANNVMLTIGILF